MKTITLSLSPAELRTMRAALADYAVLAYRQGKASSRLGVPHIARQWSVAEIAAVDVLSRLPCPKANAVQP